MKTAFALLSILVLSLAAACAGTETSDDGGASTADTGSDGRLRPDAVETDPAEDTTVIDPPVDAPIDTPPDLGGEIGDDVTEDGADADDTTAPDVTDVAVDTPGDGGGDSTTDPDVVADTADAEDDTADTGSGDAQVATPGDLVIIEVQGNPQNLEDTNAEYLEVYNRRSHPVELSGITIGYVEWPSDGTAPSDSLVKYELITDFVVPPTSSALLVRSGDTVLNGGLTPDATYGGNVISNGASTDSRVRLLIADFSDETTGLIDEMVFPGGTFGNDLRGRAYQFDMPTVPNPTAADNENTEYLCHAPAVELRQYSEGNWGTPGTGNLPCP